MKTEKINVRIPVYLRKRLEEKAKKEDVSFSAVVQDALYEYLCADEAVENFMRRLSRVIYRRGGVIKIQL